MSAPIPETEEAVETTASALLVSLLDCADLPSSPTTMIASLNETTVTTTVCDERRLEETSRILSTADVAMNISQYFSDGYNTIGVNMTVNVPPGDDSDLVDSLSTANQSLAANADEFVSSINSIDPRTNL